MSQTITETRVDSLDDAIGKLTLSTSPEPQSQPRPTSRQPLQYEPLPKDGQWIRLLELEPGSGDDPLRCTLRPAQLVEGLRFDALSYVWGKDKTAAWLDCSAGGVGIPASLEAALRRMRDATATRTLWADAACIDQQSVHERGHQVALMGLIFWSATHVRIWVGEDPLDQAQLAFTAMRTFMEAARTHAIEFGVNPLKFGLPGVPVDEVAKIDALAWEAIADFSTLPWFTRVWVQQELGLSDDATFYWGDYAINAMEVVHFKGTFMKVRPMLRRELPALRDWHKMDNGFHGARFIRSYMIYQRVARPSYEEWEAMQQATGTNFLKLLLLGRSLQATDHRDYVYGFLGHPAARWENAYCPVLFRDYRKMCFGDHEPLIQPDYSKTLEQVYVDTALALLRNNHDLSMLCAVSHTPNELSTVPSWVPQWHVGDAQHCIGADPRTYYRACAGRSWTQFPAHDAATGELRVSGLVFDSAVKIRPASRMPRFASLACHQQEGRKEGRSSRPWDVVYEDPVLAYFLTVTAGIIDRHPAEENMEMFRHDVEAHVLVKRPSYTSDGTMTLRSRSHALGQAARLAKAFNRASEGRELFRTRRGLMGIGPEGMRKGDKVVVLLGARVPMVLRRLPGCEKYTLVGECYVHGIMRGEALSWPGEAEPVFEDIVLV